MSRVPRVVQRSRGALSLQSTLRPKDELQQLLGIQEEKEEAGSVRPMNAGRFLL